MNIVPEFDSSKYYLGSLCKRKHDYQGMDKSLRNKHGNCLECARLSGIDLRRRNGAKPRGIEFKRLNGVLIKTPSVRIDIGSSMYHLGNLCLYKHNWDGEGHSLRLSSTGYCITCRNPHIKNGVLPKEVSEESRFWALVDKTDDVNQCWLWKGSERKGYGFFSAKGRDKYSAHRYSWELANAQQIPKEMIIRHTCDTPLCCNPSHLLIGTPADNRADMMERERQTRGKRNGRAKLIDEDIPKIRLRLDKGERQADIAKDFGVSQILISCIKLGKNWTHIN